jgi:hypothetical protein
MSARWGAVLVAMLLAGCGGGGEEDPTASAPATTPTETVKEPIAPPKPTGVRTFGGQSLTEADSQRFAKAMTAALRAKDERAFLKLIDPGDPAVVAQQRTWFRNVLKVPMRKREVYLVGNRSNIDSSGKRQLTADLGFEHQIRGVDPRPLAEWYEYGFHKRGGRLLVASVKGAKAEAASSQKSSRYYRQAWDDGDMAVVEGERAIFLGPESDRGAMEALIGTADAAVRQETAQLPGFGADGRTRFLFTVQAPEVADVFDYFGGRVDPTEANFEGFAQPVYSTDRKTGIVEDFRTGPVTTRIVLKRDVLGSGDAGAIIRHELVHAVTGASNGHRGVPTWIVEGTAVYFSDASSSELAFRRDRGVAYLAGARSLPGEKSFYEGDDDTVSEHYGAAYLAIGYLADEHGRGGLVSRLRRYYRTGNLRAIVGNATEAQFAARVKRWAGA